MRDAMAGVDGVFHIAGWYRIGPGPWREDHAKQINVDGTRNVLELVDELDIPKAVYTSTCAVHSDTDGDHPDESYRYDGEHISVYDRTKWRAHYEVAKPMTDDGVPVVIIQPGIVYGPGDTSDLRSMYQDYLQGDLPFMSRGVSGDFEHVEDTARAHRLAMEHGESGEEYHVSGNTHTFVEIFEIAEKITGVPAPRAVSPALFRTLAPIVNIIERVVRPPQGFESESMYRLAGTTWHADSTKAERELGIDHRPLEEGLREYLEWEMEQLGMDTDVEQKAATA
jgi:dihydroflavonol-4-reductase